MKKIINIQIESEYLSADIKLPQGKVDKYLRSIKRLHNKHEKTHGYSRKLSVKIFT